MCGMQNYFAITRVLDCSNRERTMRDTSDSDLLAFGDKFDADLAKFISLDEVNSELGWQAHKLAWERSGADRRKKLTREEVKRFFFELQKAENELGWGPISREADRRFERLIGLSKAIVATRASTTKGLAVKARAIAWYAEIWPPDDDAGTVTQTMQ